MARHFQTILSAIEAGQTDSVAKLVSRLSVNLNHMPNDPDQQSVHPFILAALKQDNPQIYRLLLTNGLYVDPDHPEFAQALTTAPNIQQMLQRRDKAKLDSAQATKENSHYYLVKRRKLRIQLLTAVFDTLFNKTFVSQRTPVKPPFPLNFDDYCYHLKQMLHLLFYESSDEHKQTVQQRYSQDQMFLAVQAEKALWTKLIDRLGELLEQHDIFNGIARSTSSPLGNTVPRKIVTLAERIAQFVIEQGLFDKLGFHPDVVNIENHAFALAFYHGTMHDDMAASDAEVLQADQIGVADESALHDFCVGTINAAQLHQVLNEGQIAELLRADGTHYLRLAYEQVNLDALDYFTSRRIKFADNLAPGSSTELPSDLEQPMLMALVKQIQQGLRSPDAAEAATKTLADMICLYGVDQSLFTAIIPDYHVSLFHFIHYHVPPGHWREALLSQMGLNVTPLPDDKIDGLIKSHLADQEDIDVMSLLDNDHARKYPPEMFLRHHAHAMLKVALIYGIESLVGGLAEHCPWVFTSRDRAGFDCTDYLKECDEDVMKDDVRETAHQCRQRLSRDRHDKTKVVIIDFNQLLQLEHDHRNVSPATLKLPDKTLINKIILPDVTRHLLKSLQAQSIPFYIVSDIHEPAAMARAMNLLMNENRDDDVASIPAHAYVSTFTQRHTEHQTKLIPQISTALASYNQQHKPINPSNSVEMSSVMVIAKEERARHLISQTYPGIQTNDKIFHQATASSDWRHGLAKGLHITMGKIDMPTRHFEPMRSVTI